MPKFTLDNAGIKKVDSVVLYRGGGDKRLYLADAKVNKYSDVALSSSNISIATAKISKNPFNGPKGIWTIDLTPQGGRIKTYRFFNEIGNKLFMRLIQDSSNA